MENKVIKNDDQNSVSVEFNVTEKSVYKLLVSGVEFKVSRSEYLKVVLKKRSLREDFYKDIVYSCHFDGNILVSVYQLLVV